MRNSRISRISRISRVSESAGGKLVSVTETHPPAKQIGVRSPRCLGPSSPFAYLKDPDFMNILPLDATSGKFCTIAVKNSTYNKKRRTLDATLEEIGRDLEHITFLFQEITPQAPVKVDKDEKVAPKVTGLQLLESVLEWLKAANFDLIWAKTAMEEKDLDNSNEAVQSLLYDSIRSIDKLRVIHNKLMAKFNDYIRHARYRGAAVAAEQKVDSIPVSRAESGLNYSALSTEVVELLQRERSRTAETYEGKIDSLKSALASQAALINKLTENLKNKNLHEVLRDRDSKTGADIESLMSKKATKHKKKPHGSEDDEGGSSHRFNRLTSEEESAKESKNKELLSLQKTLHSSQQDSARLLQQNRALIETKKELTTSNAHKDKVIGELKAKLLQGELADKPKLDKLVVAAPKVTRKTPPEEKSERPASTQSRFIYVDSAGRRSLSAGSSAPAAVPEPPGHSVMELLAAQKKLKLYDEDDDDTQESRGGQADAKGKSSEDVRDSEKPEKGGKARKSSSGDLERLQTEYKAEAADQLSKDAEKTRVAADGSVVTSAGGRAEGRVVSGVDAQGAVDGKGRDRRGKDGRSSEGAGAVDVVATRDGVSGSSGHKRELKGADDRAAGESSRSRGSVASGQEAQEGADGQRMAKRLLNAGGSGGGRKSSDERLQAAGQPGGFFGSPVSERGGMELALGVSKYSQDRSQARDRDKHTHVRYGTPDPEFGSGLDGLEDSSPVFGAVGWKVTPEGKSPMFGAFGFKGMPESKSPMFGAVGFKGMPEGKSPMFGAVGFKGMPEGKSPMFGAVGFKGNTEGKSPMFGAGSWKGMADSGPDSGPSPVFGAVSWKGMPDRGVGVGYLPTGRPGSAGQQTPGVKYDLSTFIPQHMGQRLAWLTSEKEGVVPLTEEPQRGLRVTGETALQSERPDTEMQGLTGAFPLIHPLKDPAEMARILRSYAVNLNDPNTFAQQLEFIKHSGTVDGLREAMRLLAPHLKLLQEGDEQQGENVLMDVMRALQRRHAEMITEEFQPAIGANASESRQRRLLTFVTDRREDVCSARARQRSLLTQGHARGLVHLRPLLSRDGNALSPCPPYLPAGYMEALPRKIMRNTFPSEKARRQTTSARVTKLRAGNQYVMVGLTIDSLLKTVDKLAKCGQAASG